MLEPERIHPLNMQKLMEGQRTREIFGAREPADQAHWLAKHLQNLWQHWRFCNVFGGGTESDNCLTNDAQKHTSDQAHPEHHTSAWCTRHAEEHRGCTQEHERHLGIQPAPSFQQRKFTKNVGSSPFRRENQFVLVAPSSRRCLSSKKNKARISFLSPLQLNAECFLCHNHKLNCHSSAAAAAAAAAADGVVCDVHSLK
jgi:hypothetical protein